MAEIICSSEELPPHVAMECGGEAGGIIGVAFLDNSVNFDGSPSEIESKAAWDALIAASPQLVQIIKNTRGEQPKAAKTETDGFGRKKTVVTGRTHTVTFEVLGVKENINFFNTANLRKDLKFAYVTNGDLLHYVDNVVSIDAGNVIDRDISSWEYFQVEVTWENILLPTVYDAPEDIFDE